MYEAFYHLTAEPFLLTPKHGMAYRPPSYQRAMKALQYALYLGEGFILVTGKPGIGKTILINDLLANLNTKRTIARLESSQLRVENVLWEVAVSFGISATSSQDKTKLFHSMREFLSEQNRAGQKGLLLLSEAQALTLETLEEVRLLSVLEEGGESLLQIILMGQEGLVDMVRSPGMEQLRQRILAAYHLEPLTAEETREYVMHRLHAAGWEGDPKLNDAVFPIGHEFSRGIPRYINMLCSQLFRNGYANKQHTLDIEDVRRAVEDLGKDGSIPFTDKPHFAVIQKHSGTSSDTDKLKEQSTQIVEQDSSKSASQSSTMAVPSAFSQRSTPDLEGRETPIEAEGQLLNSRFRLIKRIGYSGGTSDVYKALDLRKLEAEDDNPYVAVKILKRRYSAHGDWLIALYQVSNQFMELEHPNIVKVYDLDRDGPTIYLTMEYLSGQSLRNKIDLKHFAGMPINEVLQIVNSMGEALAFAHAFGIVHCDFKPAKVIFTQSGEIKIIDFGISKAIQFASEDNLDHQCGREYTPEYASPEKLENRGVDQRDDIYALGCTVYEMLTGLHPFNKMLATTARDIGIQPQKPNGLSRRQWKALQSALTFDRSYRTPTVTNFLVDLNGKRHQWQPAVSTKVSTDSYPPQFSQPLNFRSQQLTALTAIKGRQYLIAGTAAIAGFLGGFIGSILSAYWYFPSSYEVAFQENRQRVYEQIIEPRVARAQENGLEP